CAYRSIPCALSNSVTSPMRTCPRRGRVTPAMALTSVLLPAPERPNSPTTGASAAKRARSTQLPTCCSGSTSIIGLRSGGACGQPFGSDERENGQHDRYDAEAPRLRVATRCLRQCVDGQRQCFRLAWDVGNECDRRAELAETAGERQQNAGDDARQSQGKRDRREHPRARAAQSLGCRFETLIDAVDGKANRADHQWKTHDRRRERCA